MGSFIKKQNLRPVDPYSAFVGLISEGLISESLISEGLISESLISEGLISVLAIFQRVL